MDSYWSEAFCFDMDIFGDDHLMQNDLIFLSQNINNDFADLFEPVNFSSEFECSINNSVQTNEEQSSKFNLYYNFDGPTPNIIIEHAESKNGENIHELNHCINLQASSEEEIPRQLTSQMKRGRGRPEKSIEEAIKEYECKKMSMNAKEKRIARNNIASLKYRRNRKEKKSS